MSSIDFKNYNIASEKAAKEVQKDFGSVSALKQGLEKQQKDFDVESTNQGPSRT